MGPKKAKAKAEEVEVETSDQAEWKALKAEADRLHKQTRKEEHDFNEFQQQREKLNYFWIVEKKKLEDKRAELRNRDRELPDLEEKHQVEIKIYKQRLKHLLHEHQHETATTKTEGELAVKMAQDDDRETELGIKADKRALNANLKEIELTHEEFMRGLKREQDQKITLLRHEFERRANEIQKSFDMRMKKNREFLDKVRKDEIKAIEDHKHAMVEQLLAEHQKAFTDIKNYYNDITHNNLDYIKSLKDEVKELEIIEQKDQVKLHEKMAENKKLSAPLQKMKEDVVRLTQEKEAYEKEKADMRKVKSALEIVESDFSGVNWEYETLFQRFQDLVKERDELKKNLYASVFDVKQKSAFRGLLLEKKMSAMNRVLEEREAQLNEVLARANLDPTVLGQVRNNVQDILHVKNVDVKKLQSEVSRLKALHSNLHEAIDKKLREYGSDISALGLGSSKREVEKFLSSGPVLMSETA